MLFAHILLREMHLQTTNMKLIIPRVRISDLGIDAGRFSVLLMAEEAIQPLAGHINAIASSFEAIIRTGIEIPASFHEVIIAHNLLSLLLMAS